MGRNKKPPSRTVTFKIFESHYKRYEYDKFVASLDGRKLSMAEWLNNLVAKGLENCADDYADHVAVSIAVADLINALPTNKQEEE